MSKRRNDKTGDNKTKGRKRVGRGVNSLLGSIDMNLDVPDETTVNKLANTVINLPIERIEANKEQPRKDFNPESLQELADSIKSYGLIQPITVRHLPDNNGGRFQIISGERRFRASKLAKLVEIPAYVRLVNDQEMMEMALVENIQRQDLNAMEIAETYQRLVDEFNLTLEKLAERVGKGRSTVNNYLRLLKLPTAVRLAVKENEISMGHARALLAIDEPAKCIAIFSQVVANNLSVRQTEALARDYKTNKGENKKAKAAKPQLPFEFQRLQKQLRDALDTKVELKRKEATGKGQIVIHFNSSEHLNNILDILEKGEE